MALHSRYAVTLSAAVATRSRADCSSMEDRRRKSLCFVNNHNRHHERGNKMPYQPKHNPSCPSGIPSINWPCFGIVFTLSAAVATRSRADCSSMEDRRRKSLCFVNNHNRHHERGNKMPYQPKHNPSCPSGIPSINWPCFGIASVLARVDLGTLLAEWRPFFHPGVCSTASHQLRFNIIVITHSV